MNSEKTVAIVAPDASERRSLNQLLASEGFPVEAFPRPEGFVNGIGPARYGCLLVDLDHAGDGPCEQSLLNFAERWSRELPVIVIASDPTRLPDNPLLPSTAKSAGETRLLYLVYGALSEPASPHSQDQTSC